MKCFLFTKCYGHKEILKTDLNFQTGEMFLQNVTDIESVTFIMEQSEDSDQECLMCGYQHSDKDFQCINYLEESISKNLRLRQGSSQDSQSSSPNSSSLDLSSQEQEKLQWVNGPAAKSFYFCFTSITGTCLGVQLKHVWFYHLFIVLL